MRFRFDFVWCCMWPLGVFVGVFWVVYYCLRVNSVACGDDLLPVACAVVIVFYYCGWAWCLAV